jgi:A/G-specific adenine glycosylase
MLQQTQVATVIPYFRRFLARFPKITDLAAAEEQDVLRLWQGLGYYSRARSLQRCAQKVVGDFGGQVPWDVEALRTLPGVGRYTAGAIASIAFGRRAPILDGNVMRVICRLDRIELDPREPTTNEVLWTRATDLLPARQRIGDFNSALMELGALVCTPRQPQCLVCPVREHCDAFAAGVQDRIPPPRQAKRTPLLKRRTFCIRKGDAWLIEQRPAKGRWAGMWQFITIAGHGNSAARTKPSTPPRLPIEVTKPVLLGTIRHALTHRRYEFDVYSCDAAGDEAVGELVLPHDDRPRRWVTWPELSRYPLPRPHVKIAAMLGDR